MHPFLIENMLQIRILASGGGAFQFWKYCVYKDFYATTIMNEAATICKFSTLLILKFKEDLSF